MSAKGGWSNGRRRFLRTLLAAVAGLLVLHPEPAPARRGRPSLAPRTLRALSSADLRAPHDLAG
jgi:hypothetical protein